MSCRVDECKPLDGGLEGANAVGAGGIVDGIFGRVFPSLGSGSGVPSTDDAAQRKPKRQGLTLVPFSAQLEPCLTHKNTLHTLNAA